MIQTVVLDNNKARLEDLVPRLEEFEFLNIRKRLSTPFEAIEYLKQTRIDLVICPLQISGMNTGELFRALAYRPHFVIIAQNGDEAVDAFRLQALDYLVPPFGKARLLKTMYRCKEYFEINRKTKSQPEQQANTPEIDHILIKVEYDTIKIYLKDILYLESLKDYVRICTQDAEYLTLSSLKNFQQKLPQDQFARVHRSFIISIPNMDAIERNQVIIRKKRISMGESYKDVFLNQIQNSMT